MALIDENCIFCKIGSHEIESRVVYEDDNVLAFDDISPQAPVHVLIIPKQHYGDMGDGVPDEVMTALFRAVPEVAGIKDLPADGYRMIVNNGRHAAQTVKHLHVHVVGGAQMSHGMVGFA